MKIQDEQMKVAALLAQQSLTKKQPQTGGAGFEGLFAQELQGTDATGLQAKMPPIGAGSDIVSQMLLSDNAQETEETDPFKAIMQQAFGDASGTLDMLDSYTKSIGKQGSDNNLKDAYNMLQGIDARVAALKQSTQGIQGQNPGLDSLLNELEVMTATEKFKFNRGDYN